ncbi:MAG: hypothetical protein JRJ40_08390 [Deltaproteobacteria bacterium]|nr:hypothetical protein [Deltaproteobacteria bacterium]
MTANTTSYEQADAKIRVSNVVDGQAFILACLRSHVDASKAAAEAFARIAEVLEERKLAIVHERLFGSLSVEAAVMKARSMELHERDIRSDGPVTYVEGKPPWGDRLRLSAQKEIQADSEGRPGQCYRPAAQPFDSVDPVEIRGHHVRDLVFCTVCLRRRRRSRLSVRDVENRKHGITASAI